MNLKQLSLRQKSLLLLVGVGVVGLLSMLLILYDTDRELFGRFIPEHRALHEVEVEAAHLLQNYNSYIVGTAQVDDVQLSRSLLAVRKSLKKYQQLIDADGSMRPYSERIEEAVNELDRAGVDLTLARKNLDQIYAREEILEDRIRDVFRDYAAFSNQQLADSIDREEFDDLVRSALPDVRMIAEINRQILELFLEIREFERRPSEESLGEINELTEIIDLSLTLLQLYVDNGDERSAAAVQVLSVYDDLTSIINQLILFNRDAEQSIIRVEEAGTGLAEVVEVAIERTEIEGWANLRKSLFASGVILVITLLVSFAFVYLGLGRILRPLHRLQESLIAVSEGDLRRRAPIENGNEDEIGRLGQAFNRMADQLEENARLQQGFIEQLEEKNTELERFTYTVSHELKTPLVTVSGFIGLLERDLEAGDQDKIAYDMEQIASAMDVMSSQLEDLLELSRIGRVVNPPQRFALGPLCEEVVRLMSGAIEETSAQVNIDPDLPEVYADQQRVGEVIRNLLENGIKFVTPGDSPRIHISAEFKNGRVLCRVLDNGRGIDPQYHDKVFELFDRLDPEVPGTGVGLALVKRIIEIHRGEVWIELSPDGQGSCFCFTLPSARGVPV